MKMTSTNTTNGSTLEIAQSNQILLRNDSYLSVLSYLVSATDGPGHFAADNSQNISYIGSRQPDCYFHASNTICNMLIKGLNRDLIITKGTRKKRIWIIGSVIAVLIIILIVGALLALSSERETIAFSHQHQPTITLEDVLDGRLNPASFNATWISGNELLFRNKQGSIMKYNVVKRSLDELLPGNSPILLTAFEHELSPDRKFLLIAHDYQKIYRHSYVAQYSVINLETKQVSRIITNNDAVLQYAHWGPVNNSIVYVANFNIFYRPTAALKDFIVITTDGMHGHIYNGVPDWVYEEEVLSSNRAVWFSPDGTKLAYAKFNDTKVPLMTIPVYGVPGSLEFQYPRGIQIRYPKPGTKNPDVSLNVVELGDAHTSHVTLQPPARFAQPILSAVSWATNNVVSAIWMNRIQNDADLTTYDLGGLSPKYETIISLKEAHGWLDLFTPLKFSKNGDELIFICSQNQNASVGDFRHIVHLPRISNAQMKPITHGAFVVTEILGWDEANSLIYYQATAEHDPAVQHIYSASTNKESTPKCLTCKVTTERNKSQCLHNTAIFSTDFTHYILNCAGPDIPEISVYDIKGTKLLVWEGNDNIAEAISKKLVPTTKRLTFDIDEGFKAQVLLKLPPNLDTSGETKYPMLILVYGGPDSYQVIEKFSLDWGSYLSANKSIIYGMIDGRGSGLKGDKMLFSIYNNIGTKEIYDQINVTRLIQQELRYVDASRTAIWGWSYGGYSSGMALAMDKMNVFKCGISVAPVTDWILYDSIYTERFMGLPATNARAYKQAQLINKYEGLRNKAYYLIHGTLDDNVHYQQSMLLAKILEENDILFTQQSYTDEDHGLGSVRHHLYHSLENFLDKCFIVAS